ncbi:MAG TPA: tRNA (adenosine(37)-N6)-threonylcarbamoyltransferase complex dimerization subunit type 1 TsaB [Oscillatoriaceae cyanobacterium M33_DOE_052]|uniref:tRNA (Adenosine(37)-N6)-threonylcarbamoyltransferase complex dimerization subunit type 1 TsaB n=1 Tax=Planktothricoides sp. SpSt-374 TaxID=2282167 RepID=A0A7C3ZNB4_9CYAN|nr:tRNA (adenosine(37)-N6)-threonylcarbamoyltransferase complex dimerization subunit type 1 TsaB [Oscillatoriaceae cyanobacterium M33_DOE_052]
MTNDKYALAIHTSSPELGLALAKLPLDRDLRCQTWNLGRDMAGEMHSRLVEFIQPQTWQDLAFVAVAIGPGSFTGTRLGVVTARTLAQQLHIPLFGISSLAAAAFLHVSKNIQINLHNSSENACIAVQMPAQRGQIFGAIYELRDKLPPLHSDAVLTPQAWQETLSGLPMAYELLDIPAGAALGGSARQVLELAAMQWQELGESSNKKPQTWSEVLPFYGQHPVDG